MPTKTPGVSDPKLSPGGRTALCVGALLALNALICHKLFVTEYLPYMGSIEGAYIGLSRYILEHFPDLTWFPLWYGGIPYENTYSPLLHLVVAAVAWLSGASPALAHHATGAAVYCLGPVTLFCLAYYLSRDRVTSFVAGLAYSLLSPSMFLMPSLATDLGTVWGPRRLQALVIYGDSPHLASLMLIPLAIIALDRAVKRPTAIRFFTAALAFTAISLANWLGAFAATLAVIALLLSRLDLRWKRSTSITIGVGVAAYLLAAPWMPPTHVATIRHNAQFVVGEYPLGSEHLLYAAVLLILLAGLTKQLQKVSQGLRFSCLLLFLVGVIPLAVEWTGRYIVPQPNRYHHELGMAMVLTLSLVAVPWVRRLLPVIRVPIVVLALALAASQFYGHYKRANSMIRSIDIQTTVEYQAARRLGDNLPGKRVFASGSTRYWLNAFSDTPQVGGGFDQGLPSPLIRDIKFSIPYLLGDGERSATWLKALGAHAVIVGGLNTRDAYRDYRDPEKFEGVLDELWRDRDDVIYAVPQRSDSLARVIRHEHLVTRTPINGQDIEPVIPYVAGLEDSSLPLADIDWRNSHTGVIEAELQPQHLLSLQISHHPGWNATVNGMKKPITEDGLGMMLIEPGCAGPCRVELRYDGGMEMAAAKTLRFLTLFLLVLWIGLERSRPEVVTLVQERALAPAAGWIGAFAQRIVSKHPIALHVGALVAVNAFVCRELFVTEYLDRMGSIEGAYVGLSRYILTHAADVGWFPLWYGGVPFENAYPPLLPWAVAGFSALTGSSAALSFHVAGAVTYCLGPVALFGLAFYFTRDRWASCVAALAYSLLSATAFLIPSIAADMGSVWWPRRLRDLVIYGDTAYLMVLVLLPAAIVAIDRLLERLTPARFFTAVLASGAVLLTNWLAVLSLAVAGFCLALTRPGQSGTKKLLLLLGAAYAIAAPWIPPSYLVGLQRNAQYIEAYNSFGSVQILMLLLLAAALAGAAGVLRRFEIARGPAFSILFLAGIGVITLSDAWADVHLVPQPQRYQLEFELAVALALAWAAVWVLRGAALRGCEKTGTVPSAARVTALFAALTSGAPWTVPVFSQPLRGRPVLLAAAALVALAQVAHLREYADRQLRPIAAEDTVEYSASRWLNENLPGKRVFAAGSTQFWLNAFADNPQLGGGFDEGIRNPRIPHVRYGLSYLTGDGESAAAWLRAYGVHAIVVGGERTRDAYRVFQDPAKFDGVLPELWRDGDDVIYAVPHRSDSIAKVIRRADIVTKTPLDQNDTEAMLRYVHAFEDPSLPVAKIDWQSAGSGVINAELRREHVVSVQISHHPGWSATVDGRKVTVRRDGLGQMIVTPRCDGPCRIELRYDGGYEMTLAKGARGFVLLIGLVWAAWARRRKGRLGAV